MQTDVLLHVLDRNTREHCRRVQELSRKTAGVLYRDDVFAMQVSIAARYHDIGKVYVPVDILNKPGRLTEAEYDVIKKHAKSGFHIASEIFTRDICEMILYHHENEDGSGYYGKKSLLIPPGSQIIHVCDVYDALTTERPYHAPMDTGDALEYIRENAGKMFRPDVVEAFLKSRELP